MWSLLMRLHLTLSYLERSVSMSLVFQRIIFRKGARPYATIRYCLETIYGESNDTITVDLVLICSSEFLMQVWRKLLL